MNPGAHDVDLQSGQRQCIGAAPAKCFYVFEVALTTVSNNITL